MCKALNVSPSGYYARRKRPVSAREMANRKLVKEIEAVYNDSYETYGSPRVYRELKAQGVACSENRVARLMRLRSLRAKQVRRYKTTTKRNKKHPVAPNLLKRDFVADRPDHKWLTDITYIPTREGWLYLAAILDLYSRQIVGWAMSERMTAALTIRALKMAIRHRQPGAGLIHHSDQGSQYTDGCMKRPPNPVWSRRPPLRFGLSCLPRESAGDAGGSCPWRRVGAARTDLSWPKNAIRAEISRSLLWVVLLAD
jgi:putative transposase